MNSTDRPAPSLRRRLPRALLVLFVVYAASFALCRSLADTLLDARLYHLMIDDLNVVSRARAAAMRLGLNQIVALTSGGQPPPNLLNLPPATWQAMADELIPSDWLNAQAHGIVNAMFTWLGGSAILPPIRIDLGTVIERLRGPSGTLALLPLLENTRVCRPNEAVAPTAAPLGSYAVFMPCIRPGANLERLARASASYTADQLPDVVDFQALFELGILAPEIGLRLNQLRFAILLTTFGLWLLGGVCLLLLGVYLLISTRAWVDLPETVVRPVGLAGGLSLLLAAVLFGLAAWVAGPGWAWLDAYVALGTGDLLRDMGGYLGRAAAVRLIAWAGGMLIVAAAGWGIVRLRQARLHRRSNASGRETRTRRRFV